MNPTNPKRLQLTAAILLALTFSGATKAMAAEPNNRLPLYENYIRQYRALAIEQQKKYRIPASITLAQGLLESGAGQSELARKSNNHFGIKCHSDWRGDRAYSDDDKRNECFRKYPSVADSYHDHALFLSDNVRYAHLFKFSTRDYKKWARGLQAAGYATNPTYAERLIALIEDYDLDRLSASDKQEKAEKAKEQVKDKAKAKADKTAPAKNSKPKPLLPQRHVYKSRGLKFIYADNNDSYLRIAAETGINEQSLRRYNEVPPGDFPIKEGDIIYLAKKRKKAHKPYFDHVVQKGESMYSVAQRYGIQLQSLYQLNRKDPNYTPVEGDVLKLR